MMRRTGHRMLGHLTHSGERYLSQSKLTNSDHPLVSVVVPYFNPGSFLQEAIESVISQTYSNWELILVDDGSTDGSMEIATRYSRAFPDRIRHVWHPNREHRGRSASRNLGFLHSRGQFLAHLDADDVYVEDKLQKQLEIILAYPHVGMVFGRMLLWSSWRGSPDRLQKMTCPLDVAIEPPQFFPFLVSGRNDPAGYLIRRDVIDELGGYPEHLDFCEDWALYVRIALRYSVYAQSDYNYRYRQHEGQSCSVERQNGQFYAQFKPYLRWLLDYLSVQENLSLTLHAITWKSVIRFQILSIAEQTRHRVKRLVGL